MFVGEEFFFCMHLPDRFESISICGDVGVWECVCVRHERYVRVGESGWIVGFESVLAGT